MVVGDLMLDQYIWGQVERISPEAPIPVIRMEKEEYRLGGAASVAVNINALDCRVFLVGVVGKDYAGSRVCDILRKTGISDKGVVSSNSFQTIIKQRILTQQQQLLRVDFESRDTHFSAYEKPLLGRIGQLLPEVDGIVFSDYDKGVLSETVLRETIAAAQKYNLPIVCDPGKGLDFSRYRGVTTIKPNRSEAERASNIVLKDEESIFEAAAILKERSEAEFLAISLDKDGMLYYQDDSNYRFIEPEVPEVHDVTGAGDMVVSVIGILLASGASAMLATYMANAAAGLETSHLGVVPIPWSDILQHLTDDDLNKKITTLEKLQEEIQSNGESPLVFTNGYFDNISAGHLRFLLEIAKIPGKLIVAINSDKSILRQKGSAPLLKEQDRARLLASMENIHRVVIFDEADASRAIQLLLPDIVVKGEQFRNQSIPEEKAIEVAGARVEYIQHFSW